MMNNIVVSDDDDDGDWLHVARHTRTGVDYDTDENVLSDKSEK